MKNNNYYDIHEKAVKQRSITPDIHKKNKIKFSKSTVQIQDNVITEDEIFFIEVYQHKDAGTKGISHFGINSYSSDLKKEIITYNDKCKLESVDSTDLLETKHAEHKNIMEQVILTNIERAAIVKVISFLTYVHKPVLLDIFKRNAEGMIDINKDDTIETHPVILYRDENKKTIFVIDPSNPQYSSFLANYKDFSWPIKAGYIDQDIYRVPNNGSIGPDAHQFRDPLDIAVKLAVGFIKTPPNFNFDSNEMFLKSMQDDVTIQNITNQCAMNSNLPKIVELMPVRVRQASDYDTSLRANKKLAAMSMLSKEIEKLREVMEPVKGIHTQCGKKIAERLSVDYKPSNYSSALEDYNYTVLDVNELVCGSITNYMTNLSGDIGNLL